MKVRQIIGIILICFAVSLNAQDFKAGVIVGANLSFLSVNSEYGFSWTDDYNPGLGCEAGAYSILKISEKLNFESNILFQFLSHRDKKEMTFRDDIGRVISQSSLNSEFNYYIVLSPMLSYQVFKEWSIGSGVNLNFLVASQTKFNEYEDKPKLKNTYYRTFNIGIPIYIGFHRDNYYLRLKFDKGIINLMKDSDSFFKEIENTLTLSFGYILFSK